MKIRFILTIALLLGLVLLLTLGQAIPVRAITTILYVAPGGICSGLTPCYASVQAALDAALPGDEIRVAEGTYTDMHDCPRNDITTTGVAPAVVCLSKTVTIRGGYNSTFTAQNPVTYPTILDAVSLGRVLYITGTISPTVENLTLTHGNATGLTGYEYYGTMDVGGGVYVMTANAILINNNITYSATPGYGGGVYLGFSNSLLTGNTIENNTVTGGGSAGGGVMVFQGTPSLNGNSISLNTSYDNGGGVGLYSTNATLTGNTISTNTATWQDGGGVSVASCSPSFTGNSIHSNTAKHGGGMVLWYSSSILINNSFLNNDSVSDGSELWIGRSAPVLYHTTFTRTTTGTVSGVYITDYYSGEFSTVTMTNSIVADQGVGIQVNTGSQVTLDGVLWFANGTNTSGAGTITVTHEYSGDPAFALSDGYHLTPASAAIDRGVNAGILTDIDGQLRDPLPDLGADEYWPAGGPHFIFLPLILRGP